MIKLVTDQLTKINNKEKRTYRASGDLGIDYQDEGPWRSYDMDACGSSLEELLDSAAIAEIDQDGGELNCYSIENAPSNEIRSAAYKAIEEVIRGDK